MEPEPPADPRALALVRARLEELRGRAREGLREVRGALRSSLAALQREEARARGERARLRRELSAVGAANERAGRTGAAAILALQRQLGGLHARLSATPTCGTAREAETLLTRAAALTLTLTRPRLVFPPRAATLGELRLEEEVLHLALDGGSCSSCGEEADAPRPEEPRGPGGEQIPDGAAPAAPCPPPPAGLAGAGTLFRATAVLVGEGDSDSGGERGPPAGDSSRWASAESLGTGPAPRPWQTPRGPESLGAPDSRLPGPRSPRGWLPARPDPAGVPVAPSRPCDQLVGRWGRRGGGPGQLYLPHGLHAAAATGCLYVVDFGNRRLQEVGGSQRVLPLRGKAYFDVAVAADGRLALSSPSGRCVELYSAGGLLLQALRDGLRGPRGIAAHPRGGFLVADVQLGALHVLGAGRGGQLERRESVPGFRKPYLVAANAAVGAVAVSERGLDGGCCVKVLGPGPAWPVLRVLGTGGCPPLLTSPWGVSLDGAGRVLVADWGRRTHAVLCYPPGGPGWPVATQGLSSPRGLALLGEQHLVVADSMHHCLKAFRYC